MAMYQVYDALRGLTDECVSVYLGDILVYSLTMAARRTHLWMVLDWMLESRLHVCAGVSDFWSVRCHYECILALECGFRSLPPVAPGSPRTTNIFMHRRRWPATPSLVKGMQQLVGLDTVDSKLHLLIAESACELTAWTPTAMVTPV